MSSTSNIKSRYMPFNTLLLFVTAMFLWPGTLYSQTLIHLYKDQIPGAINRVNIEKADTVDRAIYLGNVSRPSLTMFLPSEKNANGTAVVICPGGGYTGLSISHEGYKVAEEFKKAGVAAFVLKYRLPNDKTMLHKETGPLQDAQEAIKLIRKNYKKWNIDTIKVGIIGFSAGGHLASTAGTHFYHPVITDKDKTSVRPDFMILIYPVISMMDSITHKGSRRNLLGSAPSLEKKILFSNELQVTTETPPAFLVHAQEDELVPVQNSILFYNALLKNKVPVEMHIYAKGKHGFGLNNTATKDLWFERCKNWMDANGWLNNP